MCADTRRKQRCPVRAGRSGAGLLLDAAAVPLPAAAAAAATAAIAVFVSHMLWMYRRGRPAMA